MYLFLWCFIYGLKLLKIVTNWYTWEWVRFFSLGFKNLAQRAAKYTAQVDGKFCRKVTYWFQESQRYSLPLKGYFHNL